MLDTEPGDLMRRIAESLPNISAPGIRRNVIAYARNYLTVYFGMDRKDVPEKYTEYLEELEAKWLSNE